VRNENQTTIDIANSPAYRLGPRHHALTTARRAHGRRSLLRHDLEAGLEINDRYVSDSEANSRFFFSIFTMSTYNFGGAAGPSNKRLKQTVLNFKYKVNIVV